MGNYNGREFSALVVQCPGCEKTMVMDPDTEVEVCPLCGHQGLHGGHMTVEARDFRLNPFADARRLMAGHLREDEGLRQGYEANVAMLLHDTYDITLPAKRNQAAKDILRLVFES